ncbi:neurofilament medium polypeptide [Sinocyclocheilus anshuiensis]|uniref:Neurofilament medium polypeptide-like n=1 Tax=Sinocyclocheilus anshuiensis TaxID=1608454 RepID=A0A671K4F1_9TELE|nr:PREDICTED: neurofilament medium polypeptide-like [Sinocyclocheilus anshuiensis]
MGNFWDCCGRKNPCDHTEDETKGLLHSSESKTSTKAGTEVCTSPTSDEEHRHEDETKPQLGESVITKQPNASAQILNPQSSYPTTISLLRTEVSLAAEVNHNVSLETAPTEAIILATEPPKTETEITEEIQNIEAEVSEAPQDTVQAPAENVASMKGEIEAPHRSFEEVDITAALTDDAGATTTSSDSTVSAAVETPVKEAPVEEATVLAQVESENSSQPEPETHVEMIVEEKEMIQTEELTLSDTNEVTHEEAENSSQPELETHVEMIVDDKEMIQTEELTRSDSNEVTHEEAENSSQPELETHVEMIVDEKEMIQTEELTRSDTSEVTHEEAGLNDTGNISLMGNSSKEPDSCVLGKSNESDVIEESVAEVTAVEPIAEQTAEVEDKLSEDIHSEMAEQKQVTSEVSQPQEHSQEASSPNVDITNGLSPVIENGLVKDPGSLKVENEINDVMVVEKLPQTEDIVQESNEETLETESKEQLSSKPSTQTDSTIDVDKPEVMDSVKDLEKSEKVAEQERETTELVQNGLDSTCASVPSSPIEKTRLTEPTSDSVALEDTEDKGEVPVLNEPKLVEEVVKDAETGPQKTEDEKEKQEEEASVAKENEGKEDTSATPKSEILFSSSTVEVKLIQIQKDTEESMEEVHETLDEYESAYLYLGAEEIEMGASNNKTSKPLLELTIPGVETRCSLAPAVDILAYSEREWKGNTARSALIRKGYSEMSRSFSGLRRVRGDNYCALRATLYQLLANSTAMPTWLQDEGFLLLPEKIEAQDHLIGGWVFPPECKLGSEKESSVERLKCYLDLLKKKWQAAAACESSEEKHNLCERVFQGGEEEYGLLEALKFLMLAKAVELHHNMTADQEVPVFCWLLFARDTSENPQTLLANHLSQIGFSGGVEQVEMFLLGYALKHTIQAFRLYMTDTEEFVTHYPDDHKQEWPCVCIVTEDDRHYNVPVRRSVQHQHREDITMT